MTGACHSFDRAALLAKLGGDEAVVAGLLGVALRSSETMPENLRAACAAGDLGSAAQLAHRIKGTAGDLVAEGLRARAAAAELAAREGVAGAIALNLQLADALEEFLVDLRRALAE